MAKSKKHVLSVEVYTYPYCGALEDIENYLSNKICCYTIKIRKKIIRKTKQVFVYGQLILCLGNGIASTQAIGLPILPNTPAIMKASPSNVGLSKKAIIAQVIKEMPTEIEHKRFDATLEHALAWKRLETGIHTEDDVTWIKHGWAERHHELKYDSEYSKAHERAQGRYNGYPWENKF